MRKILKGNKKEESSHTNIPSRNIIIPFVMLLSHIQNAHSSFKDMILRYEYTARFQVNPSLCTQKRVLNTKLDLSVLKNRMCSGFTRKTSLSPCEVDFTHSAILGLSGNGFRDEIGA